ncbi:hypothetical protein REPUB_Repub17cG0013600 [Reevesia pubescens]
MVFVNNLSTKVHWRWVETVFQKFGRVVDVFFSQKKQQEWSQIRIRKVCVNG